MIEKVMKICFNWVMPWPQ